MSLTIFESKIFFNIHYCIRPLHSTICKLICVMFSSTTACWIPVCHHNSQLTGRGVGVEIACIGPDCGIKLTNMTLRIVSESRTSPPAISTQPFKPNIETIHVGNNQQLGATIWFYLWSSNVNRLATSWRLKATLQALTSAPINHVPPSRLL